MPGPSGFRRDPRDAQSNPDPRGGDRENHLPGYDQRNGGSMWSWLAGVAAVIFIIAIVYGFFTRHQQTTLDRNAPAAATGSAPSGASTTGMGDVDGARRMGVAGTGSSSSGGAPNAPRPGGQ